MIDIEKRNFEGITLIESWPVEKNHAYCSPEAYKFIGGMVDELQAAREKIAEQGGLISRQGIEIMNQLEEIARQAEELELLRALRGAVINEPWAGYAPIQKILEKYDGWRTKQEKAGD